MPPTPNGDSSHEARLQALEAARKELEDAMVVMAHLEKKAGERIKEHAQILADHQQWLKKHDEYGERIDKLVSAIADLVSRIPPETLRR